MTIRRAAGALLAIGLLSAALAPGVGAAAQLSFPVRLTLVEQTPWTSNEHPMLHVAVLAANDGAATLDELALEVAIGSPFDSRFDYETALSEGPSSVAASVRVPQDGTLEPGTARVFRTKVDVSTWPVTFDDSKVYPLRVQVLQGGETVGSLASAEIHLKQTPIAPLLFSWWATLQAPQAFDPGGELVDPSFEAALQPDGAIGAPIAAMEATVFGPAPPAAIDLVVQPSMLAELVAMADGYTRSDGTEVEAERDGAAAAAAALAALRRLAAEPSVELIALPYAAPSVPALLRNLVNEARLQLTRGTQAVRGILGVPPTTAVGRPPDGALSADAIEWFGEQGRSVLLGDADTIERPVVPLGFAPVPTGTVANPNGTTSTLVLPDPSVDGLLGRTDLLADPIRAAQSVLGELAVIWKESPAPTPPERRGIAIEVPPTLPPGVFTPLLDRLGRAPFLRPVAATELAADVSPAGPPASLRTEDTRAFPPSYAERIRGLRGDVAAYASMLATDSAVPGRLRDALLVSEGAQYLSDLSGGTAWHDGVASTTQRAFASTTPEVQQLFTFTSRRGTIPLRMGDPGDVPLTVTVRLSSSQFEFPAGDEQTVVLRTPDQIVSFLVLAKAAGRNPISVLVSAPSGRTISQQTIVVGTTAVNGIALGLTLVAAGGLFALYARRWVRRRRT